MGHSESLGWGKNIGVQGIPRRDSLVKPIAFQSPLLKGRIGGEKAYHQLLALTGRKAIFKSILISMIKLRYPILLLSDLPGKGECNSFLDKDDNLPGLGCFYKFSDTISMT